VYATAVLEPLVLETQLSEALAPLVASLALEQLGILLALV